MNSDYLIALAALLAAAIVVAFFLVRLWLRRRGPRLGQALQDVAIDRLQNVLVPDGMGGQIQVEHLLLTANGLVVIDVKEFEGTIFAGERMAEWTVIGARGRFTFPNPLGTLYDRVAALKQIVRDVPVVGFVLFGAGADFTKGRPKDVVLPGELVERYRKPDQADLERLLVAFAPHWERVKGAIQPVTAGARASPR
ncbi:MAG TPA: nuclease-related domain-containing protein [Gammaproteobacteria bacterium]|nr:nuclease-related domain-containing protein [Gammaproteobacteria bacterium]